MLHPEQAPFVIICINVMLVVIRQNPIALDAIQTHNIEMGPALF